MEWNCMSGSLADYAKVHHGRIDGKPVERLFFLFLATIAERDEADTAED